MAAHTVDDLRICEEENGLIHLKMGLRRVETTPNKRGNGNDTTVTVTKKDILAYPGGGKPKYKRYKLGRDADHDFEAIIDKHTYEFCCFLKTSYKEGYILWVFGAEDAYVHLPLCRWVMWRVRPQDHAPQDVEERRRLMMNPRLSQDQSPLKHTNAAANCYSLWTTSLM